MQTTTGVVFNAAGLNPSIEHVEDDITLINGMGAMNVVDGCIVAGVGRLVFTSSASVGLLGTNVEKPIDGENEEECIDRIVTLNEGLSKDQSEQFNKKRSMQQEQGPIACHR